MADAGSDRVADRFLSAEPIYLSDLDICGPPNNLSSVPLRGRWRLLDYETGRFKGKMLVAGEETAAPRIAYPLQRSGWYAISFGFFSAYRGYVQSLVKLSDEDTYSTLTLPPAEAGGGERINEVFWKVADLTGTSLEMKQLSWRVGPGDGPEASQCSNARIAYIKLVPLSDQEVGMIRIDRQRTDRRRLFAHNDGHAPHYSFRPTSAEEIRRHVEMYRDTDFSRIYWEAARGDHTHYFSKIGTIPTYDGLGDFDRQGDRLQGESWRSLREQGIDPLRVVADHAHEVGLEFHAAFRVAAFYYPPPLDHFNHGAYFYKQHPELRGEGRDGRRTPRLSYAYPKMRSFAVSLLREIAEGYPVDGVSIEYNRSPPLVEYEPPVVEGFKAEYGEDPRALDEMDERWLSYRARVLTQFMIEVRRAMDEAAAQKGGGRIGISAIVFGDEQENLVNAMDLKAWVEAGVVDTLIPHSSSQGVSARSESWSEPGDLDYFLSLTRGTSCKLAPNILPRHTSPEAYRRRAAALYEAGVENLFFWDTDVQPRANPDDPRHRGSWDALRRLGHRDELGTWSRAGQPDLTPPTMEVLRLGEWDMSYRSPG